MKTIKEQNCTKSKNKLTILEVVSNPNKNAKSIEPDNITDFVNGFKTMKDLRSNKKIKNDNFINSFSPMTSQRYDNSLGKSIKNINTEEEYQNENNINDNNINENNNDINNNYLMN